jgi:hypothetical protein
MRRRPQNGVWGRMAVMFGIMVFLICFCPLRLVLLAAALLLVIAGCCSWRC